MLILVQLLFKVQPQWLAGEQRNYVMPPVSLQSLTYGTLSSLLTHCFDSLIRKKYKTVCCWLDLHVICSIQMSNYWKSGDFFFRVCYWHSPFSGATWQNRTTCFFYVTLYILITESWNFNMNRIGFSWTVEGKTGGDLMYSPNLKDLYNITAYCSTFF